MPYGCPEARSRLIAFIILFVISCSNIYRPLQLMPYYCVCVDHLCKGFLKTILNYFYLSFLYFLKFRMIKIQNKIHAGCNVLEYYLNHKFLFKTENYDKSFRKMNLIDKSLYYNRANVSVFFVSSNEKL